jgi:SNF2 family DNA or RNA helicase
VLRQALGLEGAGTRVQVDGGGWAADLLAKVSSGPPEPITEPEGFRGTLRSYQAEALGWLKFLDDAGLGGCLALDMGLGKTATVLARIATTAAEGPTLAVVPQAVLTNWANEAHRFAPSLRVRTHHGPNRADDIASMAARADLVITTFGTAVRDVDALKAIDWRRMVIDEAQNAKNPASETAQVLRLIPARSKIALTGTPIENGLGDLWAVLDLTNPGLVGSRNAFIAGLGGSTGGGSPEAALRALNGLLLFRRTKAEPAIAAELPDKIDELEQCAMTAEQIGLYQAVLDKLQVEPDALGTNRNLRIIAAITALKQICDHPAAYTHDDEPLAGRSGKLTRLEEVADVIVENGEKLLVFTHFAQWGERLAPHLAKRYGFPVGCYHGGLSRAARDQMVEDFNRRKGAGILVLSLKAGGTGLNLTAANHVVLYDRWWNPAVEDQARDRAWRIGQTSTVVSRRFVCPGTVDEKVEEVVEGKRRIADLVLPKASSLADLTDDQLRTALGLRVDQLVAADDEDGGEKVVAA